MDTITCPLCRGDMKSGRAAVRKSIAAKLSWPFYSDRLFFKPDGENQKSETVIREGASYAAYVCTQCESVLVTKNRT